MRKHVLVSLVPLALASVALGFVTGCTTTAEGEKVAAHEAASTRAALHADGSLTLAFGENAGQLGFAPALPERAAMGAPAVGTLPNGELLVLDALHGRVLKVEPAGTVREIARVDRDADDLAVGPDGAFAVKRTTTPKIVVYTPTGARQGELDYRILQDAERIELGVSRRVTVVSAHQERYLLGSPTFPLSPAEVLHSKREGVAERADGAGLQVLRDERGLLSLVAVRADAEAQQGRAVEVGRVAIGRGASARVVGVTGNVACLRVETLEDTAVVSVRREAVCVDAATGAVVFRSNLGAPGAFVPHRELTFSRGRLTFAKPATDGLQITTFAVAEKSR
ncbi:MAG: hypothetical protein IPF92_26700 [Myxococcales bacterium]|nr:hypothetical protein [Myxococcales bacterium]MBL0194149.1 hypothetical protein [Myxococcales bacterium]HQY60259.1 hypothetical protein [Polyangiaceae bacterium]